VAVTTETTRELEKAQAALLARHAPATRVRRIAWSQGETQVLELGEGAPLLLVHGGGDAAFEWATILRALARGRRVVALDRPGHGLADAYDYRGVDLVEHAPRFLGEILDALELSTVDIVANSMGGLWSVLFALSAPERVSRLGLVGAPPGVSRWAPLPLRLFGMPLVGRSIGRRLLSDPTRESSRRFWGELLVAHPERLDDALLDADVAHMCRNSESIVGLLGGAVGPAGLDRRLVLGARWQQLEVPTLFLHGDRDAFMTARVRNEWAAIESRSSRISTHVIADAGHLPWFDRPEAVVEALDGFLPAPSMPTERRTP
jgi:pimeloyl-ACP methyl ester carboxylesterase